VKSSVIFVTKIKTRTRIIGLRFQKTSTRIIVIQNTKTKISTKKTNDNDNYLSEIREILRTNFIFILFPTKIDCLLSALGRLAEIWRLSVSAAAGTICRGCTLSTSLTSIM